MTRRARRGSVLLAATAAALVTTAVAAGAHPAVESSSPPDAAVLDSSPGTVTVRFGEGVEAPLGSIRVYDAASQRVDLDDARLTGPEQRTVTVSLPEELPDGAYVVIWRAIGLDDGHLVLGQQHFVVDHHGAGTVETPAAGLAPPGTDRAMTGTIATATAAVGGAATAVAAGLAAFGMTVLGRGRRPDDERWRGARLAATRVLRGAVAVAVVASLATIPTAAAARAAAFGTPLDTATVAGTLVSPVGTAALARAVLLLPLLVTPLLRLRWLVASTTLLAAASLAVDGHVTGAALTAAVVHVLVVASWAGGLVGLAVAVHRGPATDGDGLVELLRRSSGLFTAVVVVGAATGAAVAVATAGLDLAPASTPWGRAMVTKGLLVAAAVLVAAHTRWVLSPRLATAVRPVPTGAAVDVVDPATVTPAPSTAPDDVVAAVRRNVVLEVVVVTAVVLVSGGLSSLDPTVPAAEAGASTSGTTTPAAECAVGPVPAGVALAHDC